MTIPADVKSTMLTNFHTYLLDPDWKYMDSKEKDRMVLEDFPTVCFFLLRSLSIVNHWIISCIRLVHEAFQLLTVVTTAFFIFGISALMLLIGYQKGHNICKILLY